MLVSSFCQLTYSADWLIAEGKRRCPSGFNPHGQRRATRTRRSVIISELWFRYAQVWINLSVTCNFYEIHLVLKNNPSWDLKTIEEIIIPRLQFIYIVYVPGRGRFFPPPPHPYKNFVHNFIVSEYITIKFYDISNEPILHVLGKFYNNIYYI